MADAVSILNIQICYAKPESQILLNVEVPTGTTLQEAIFQSGILKQMTEIDLTVCRVGIYGKLKPFETVLREQDRIEIYRPLTADPKESRRNRAVKKAKRESD